MLMHQDCTSIPMMVIGLRYPLQRVLMVEMVLMVRTELMEKMVLMVKTVPMVKTELMDSLLMNLLFSIWKEVMSQVRKSGLLH